MMNAPAKKLSDQAARITALTAHDRSLLVEAGAGSGKTAIMAGRVAMMLAEGVPPRTIAAVTFTELPPANCSRAFTISWTGLSKATCQRN